VLKPPADIATTYYHAACRALSSTTSSRTRRSSASCTCAATTYRASTWTPRTRLNRIRTPPRWVIVVYSSSGACRIALLVGTSSLLCHETKLRHRGVPTDCVRVAYCGVTARFLRCLSFAVTLLTNCRVNIFVLSVSSCGPSG
jgi:hypothetical protein